MANSTKLIYFAILIGLTFGAPNHIVKNFPPPKTYTGFNRTCTRSIECNFTPNNSSEKVWLLCENRACICDRNIYIAYAKSWGLRWDGKHCTIGKHGPCGESNGLIIGCQEGLVCNGETQKCVKSFAAERLVEEIPVNTAPPTVTTMTTLDFTYEPLKIENFSRYCERPTDCQFKPSETSDRIWLSCEENTCNCMRFPNLADVKDIEVNWNGTDCLVGLGGPCGVDNGLMISCSEKNTCVKHRCRAKPHSLTLNQSCEEDRECQEGLFCKVTGFHLHPIKRCVH